MVDISDIRTKFVLDKLKETSFRKKQYIEDLIWLEQGILGKIYGTFAHIHLRHIEDDYPKERKEILKELKGSKEYKKFQNKERHRIEELKIEIRKERAAEKRELAREKREWIKFGGKV